MYSKKRLSEFRQPFLFSTLWSWAESNRRPNKQQKCFLHAYPFIDFRMLLGKRHPRQNLILFILSCNQGAYRTSPKLRAPRWSGWNQACPPAGCLVTAPCAMKCSIYCTSIKRQERN